MISFILWYLAISILGWLSLPLAYRLLPALADRGYAFIRTLGLLLWGYIFWLLASLQILRNDLGGLLFASFVLLTLSAWSLHRTGWDGLRTWLSAQRRMIFVVEALFLLAFLGMVVIRAANPDIFGTEKPMELAFINAILRSPTFPPHDPWLSGYAISYYYFGYVMIAMLAKLTGTPGGVAFNLGISLVFALSAVGAYGVVYDLLGSRGKREKGREERTRDLPASNPLSTILPLLGPFFVLLISNLEGFLEVLHARGLLPASFWQWLDILDINQPPQPPFSWLPRLFGTGSWWWWRASRVVRDFDFAHNPKEIIDEFPVFSYILSDLHPHVLAMPFAFLAMALALNLFLGGGRGFFDRLRLRMNVRTLAWLSLGLVALGLVLVWVGVGGLSLKLSLLGILSLVAGGFAFVFAQASEGGSGLGLFVRQDLGDRQIGLPLYLNLPALILAAVVMGGLAFLNTWDFPFYVALFAGAYAFRRLKAGQAIKDFIGLGLVLGIGGVLLYLPFYLGFSSQAGGILPNLIYPTRGAQMWVMFAPLLLPLIAYLVYLLRSHPTRLLKGLALSLGVILTLWILSLLLGFGIVTLPGIGDYYLSVLAAPSWPALFQQDIIRRLVNSGGWITLWILLGILLGLFLGGRSTELAGEEESNDATVSADLRRPSLDSGARFGLLLALLATLLVLGPEFFYLRDLFGYRINTIFKFYYQAWLLWGVVAAYGTAILLRNLRFPWNGLYQVGLVIVLGMGLTYTVLGFWDKTHGFDPPQGWTLDGTAFIASQSPDEMAAVDWLRSAPPGVVAEAVGGSYTGYARIAMLSGDPDVVGWEFHEIQWGRSNSLVDTRSADVKRLYCSRNWEDAKSVILQYQIRYIYIGTLERSAYTPQTCGTGLNEAKFAQNLQPVFKQGDVTIYEVPNSPDEVTP